MAPHLQDSTGKQTPVHAIGLTCPLCHGPLEPDRQGYLCARDQRTYPVTFGIPDLRVFHGDIVDAHSEGLLIERLLAEYPTRSFSELIELDRTLDPAMPCALLRRRRAHILGGVARAKNSLAELDCLQALPEKGQFLELGCGAGGFLVAATEAFPTVVGLDIDFPRLILAKKQLEENGRHAVLIAGNAEFLPFPDESFHLVVGSDVIEHVENPLSALRESHRVLIGQGAVFLATPNRWSLTPEPHVDLWGVGFLPKAWREPYVRLLRKLPYRHINLLNWFELRTLLSQTQFRRWEIILPSFSSALISHMPRWARRVVPFYHAVKGTSLTKWLLFLFGPLFHIVCLKEEVGVTGPLGQARGDHASAIRMCMDPIEPLPGH